MQRQLHCTAIYYIVKLPLFHFRTIMVALGRVEPEVAKEHGLIPATRIEMLAELRTLFRKWQPWSQAFFMNHGSDFSALAGLLPGYFFAKNFR